MLQKIRKTADSVIFRICLGIIVAAFSIWGVSDVAKGRGNSEIVTFDDISPITYEDFSVLKAKEIKNIQRNEGVSLSEEQIAKMNLDNEIIGMLVRKKLIAYIAKNYDLDFSDSIIADVIKTLPSFKDEKGAFHIERFKAHLHANDLTTEEYSEEIKNYITRTMVLGSFIGNSYISNARISNIIDHMSEKRNVDIASISLIDNRKMEGVNLAEDKLKSFYDENKDMFKTPEIRDICYAKIDSNIAKNHAIVTDQEVKQFWTDNRAEIGNNSFDKIKSEIKLRLQKQKSDTWISEISKSLEDEVAGGSSLPEIADKYRLKRICEKNIMAQNIETKANGVFAAFASQIYEMSENEVSYPFENADDGVILFELSRHVKEAQQDFDSVKPIIAEKYKAFAYRQESLKNLQDLASRLDKSNFNKDVAAYGMNLQLSRSFSRSELAEIKTLPPEMLIAMFSSDRDVVVGPFVGGDFAYMLVVRKAFCDKDTKRKIESSRENISERIKEGLMEELLLYVRVRSDMKVKMDPASLSRVNKEAVE